MAVIWDADFGILTLDEVISGGVEQFGWDYLESVKLANLDGYLVGIGHTMDGGSGVYLTHVVPEPSTLALLLGALSLGAFYLRRKHRSA